MLEEELILFSFVKRGVRARGAKGGLPQIFESPIFGGQQEKIWAKPVFKGVFMFFFFTIIIFYFFYALCIFYFYYYFIIFHVFKILTWSRRNIPVTSTRDSGCVARDEFLVREGYHMLIYIFVFFIVRHCTSWIGLFLVVNWLE